MGERQDPDRLLSGSRPATTAAPPVARKRDRIGAQDWVRYLRLMAPLDAMTEIGNVDTGCLYFQYGTADGVVPVEVSVELSEAADGARADAYDAGHALDGDATADRVAWLVERLDRKPIPPSLPETVGLPGR